MKLEQVQPGVLGISPKGVETTWRRRYIDLQKFVAKRVLKRFFREARVLDLGCGISNCVSPASESFFKMIRINGVPVKSYVAVDKLAETRKLRGISYRKADVVDFMQQRHISNPNVIIALRVFEWLGYDRELGVPSDKAARFQKLCWEKLPEKGILVADIQLHGAEQFDTYWGEAERKPHQILPAVIRKVNGKPQILFFLGIKDVSHKFGVGTKSMMKIISKTFSPPSFDIYKQKDGWSAKER